MIRNDREYEITKARLADFERSLRKLEKKGHDKGVHPLIHKAQCEALQSQILDLQAEIAEYDELRTGKRSVLESEYVDDLPRSLIAARIASGLTQHELAARLKVPQHQVENIEATEYASASFAELKAIANTLGVAFSGNVFGSAMELSDQTLMQRLSDAGLERDFIMRQILHRNPGDDVRPVDVLRGTSNACKIFGWEPADIFARTTPLAVPTAAGASAYFKVHATAQERRTLLISAYARFMAALVLKGTRSQSTTPVSQDSKAFRAELIHQSGCVDLKAILSHLWRAGVVVVPLREGGGFHGACWRINGRNVIVLKQRTGSEARWMYDLLHETYHAGAEAGSREFELIDEESMPRERRTDPEEQQANQFAADVLLDGQAEKLAAECVEAARGSVERLKIAVPKVASKHDVPVGALANYMAWRLSLQDIDWWGTATNLQADDEDPWGTARDFLFERLDWSRFKRVERDLLSAMLSEE